MRSRRLNNLCSFLLILVLSAQPLAIGRIVDTFFSLAVSKGRSRPSGDAVVEFDEFGGIPQLKNTFKAVAKASVIVAIRSVNATVLSYTAKNSSSLQVPVGAQPLNGFIDSKQYMLITGLAGDARTVIRHAKQVALNYTVAFDTAPTGRFIAHEVGRFLQEHTVRSGMRPLHVMYLSLTVQRRSRCMRSTLQGTLLRFGLVLPEETWQLGVTFYRII